MTNDSTHALYVGKFNEFHTGHVDIFMKAKKCFHFVSLGSPSKENLDNIDTSIQYDIYHKIHIKNLLSETVTKYNEEVTWNCPITCIVRGIRNTKDFEYEKDLLYWYEDSGLTIPVVHIIADRQKCHISSSSIKEYNKLKGSI